MNTIEISNLTKKYGDLTAVNSVSLNVKSGNLFGLLGQNGSGKTTIIKMLTGQITITSGTCSVLCVSPDIFPIKVREICGIIPEQETPPGFLTSREYLSFAAKIRNLDDIDKKTDWWFDFLDFSDKKDILCKDLSRGTRQKLMFAQAFLHNPELAIIDEPLINLDPLMQKKIKEFLKEYVASGKTIFISTHILEIAEEICSDFAIIHKGNLLHSGKMSDLKEKGIHLEDFFASTVNSKIMEG